MCVADDWNEPDNNETLILRIRNGQVEHWRDSMMYAGMVGIWFVDTGKVFLCGGGLVRSYHKGQWKIHYPPFNGFPRAIRGTGFNDVFIAGDFGAIQHWNGKTWKYYPDPAPYDQDFVVRHISSIHNNVYLAGNDNAAIWYVIHGRRE